MRVISKELAKDLYSSYSKGKNNSEPSFLYFSKNIVGDDPSNFLDASSVYIGSLLVLPTSDSPFEPLEGDLILDLNLSSSQIQPLFYFDVSFGSSTNNFLLEYVCFTEAYLVTAILNVSNFLFVGYQFRQN